MKETDVLKRIIEQVRQVAPEISEDRLFRIAAGIAQDIGGERHYIPKKPAMQRVNRALDVGLSVVEAIAKAGASATRSTGYRVRKRGRLV